MILNLPPPPPSIPAIPNYLQSLLRSLTSAFSTVISANQAAPRVILRSPNGTVYAVTVDDAGAVQTAVAPKSGF